jgi:hypothetical protein
MFPQNFSIGKRLILANSRIQIKIMKRSMLLFNTAKRLDFFRGKMMIETSGQRADSIREKVITVAFVVYSVYSMTIH